MKQIVVAYDKQRGIGDQNDLLWGRDLPADLLRFRDITQDTAVIMGRKTLESIGRSLPDRRNIVVSKMGMISIPGVEVASSLEQAYDLAGVIDISVIGGGMIYEQAISVADVIYATEVDATFAHASVFFPDLPITKWQEVDRHSFEADKDNAYSYSFVTYARTDSQ